MAGPTPPKPLVSGQYGITTPSSAVGIKAGGIAFYDHNEFTALIELAGARLAWSRMSSCPCARINTETSQPDPRCKVCNGDGFFRFGPANYVPPAEAGVLDTVQQAVVATDGAAVIRGIIDHGAAQPDAFDKLGDWNRGAMFVTVRAENVIGYFDRLVNLDSVIATTEVRVMPADGSLIFPLRYPVVSFNAAFSVTLGSATPDRFYTGLDFELTSTGQVSWYAGRAPAPGTRISWHYLSHPAWIVSEHPHVARETPNRKKTKSEPKMLPLRAEVKLEYVPIPAGV